MTGLGGHVLKRLGDGLMALFGYPQVQENDGERAVRAALAIQRELSGLDARNAAKGMPELSARIGIDAGPVVVETTGEVFGDAPNVAARVQTAAEPGSVLVTMNVQRQVAGLFVAEERGARELKGVAEPVQLFRIVRASGGGRRGGVRTLTPFVAREEELGVLSRSVNGAAIFLKSGAGKFPSLAGWRSAVCVIGASVLWRPSATLQGRWNWIGGGVRLEADVFGQEVGVLAQPIARPFDLDDDGVVKQSVEKGGGDDGIAEDLAPFGEAAV